MGRLIPLQAVGSPEHEGVNVMGQTHSPENSDAYTVVVFRGSTAKPLRFSFPRKFVRKLLIVGCLLVISDLLVISHYVIRTGEVWELAAFRNEAMSAREQTAAFSTAIDDLKKRISMMKEVKSVFGSCSGLKFQRRETW